MYAQTTWYAEGIRWIGSVLHGLADYLDRTSSDTIPDHIPMPRHVSAEEVLSDMRNRLSQN